MIEIRNTSGEVIYTVDVETVRDAVHRAVSEGVSLAVADLSEIGRAHV